MQSLACSLTLFIAVVFFFFPNAVESCSHSILLYPTRTSTIALVWLNFGGETLNGFEVIELIFLGGGGGKGSKVTPWKHRRPSLPLTCAEDTSVVLRSNPRRFIQGVSGAS